MLTSVYNAHKNKNNSEKRVVGIAQLHLSAVLKCIQQYFQIHHLSNIHFIATEVKVNKNVESYDEENCFHGTKSSNTNNKARQMG